MNRQERNMEERMDRLQQQPSRSAQGGQRSGYQGRAQSRQTSEARQAGGGGYQQGNDQTPTGTRWADPNDDYEDQGTPMDGGDERKGGL